MPQVVDEVGGPREDRTRDLLIANQARTDCVAKPSRLPGQARLAAANLMERVLPQTGLRQWVLTFPFPWRRRLAQDGALLGNLTRIFMETVQTLYAGRAAQEGALGAKTGAVTAVQRTSSDLRLNPHLHAVVLDGAWHEQGGGLWQGLGHLKISEVGAVLESTVRRIERHLRRRGLRWSRARPGATTSPLWTA